MSKPEFSQIELDYVKSSIDWASRLWEEKELVLTYNPNYADFLFAGSLDNESGDVVFISTNETPEGAIFDYLGVKVIKKEGHYF